MNMVVKVDIVVVDHILVVKVVLLDVNQMVVYMEGLIHDVIVCLMHDLNLNLSVELVHDEVQ